MLCVYFVIRNIQLYWCGQIRYLKKISKILKKVKPFKIENLYITYAFSL